MSTPQSLSLSAVLLERARQRRRKVGIGVTSPTDDIIAGLKKASEFCDPYIYGVNLPGFVSVASSEPQEALFADLEAGKIDAVIRGQIHALPYRDRFVRPYDRSFQPMDELINVLEFPNGRPLLVSPGSNTTIGTVKEKEKLLNASIRFCQLVGLPVRIGLLAQCREGDLVGLAGTPLVQVFRETDTLVELFRDRFEIKNYGIDFENAYKEGVTILIEPNGTTGNQVIRTLHFLDVVRLYGAPYMNGKSVVLESFKNSREFSDDLLLAAALANSRNP